MLLVSGAFAAGVACTILVVALPLRPATNGKVPTGPITIAGQAGKDAAASSEKSQIAANKPQDAVEKPSKTPAQADAGKALPAADKSQTTPAKTQTSSGKVAAEKSGEGSAKAIPTAADPQPAGETVASTDTTSEAEDNTAANDPATTGTVAASTAGSLSQPATPGSAPEGANTAASAGATPKPMKPRREKAQTAHEPNLAISTVLAESEKKAARKERLARRSREPDVVPQNNPPVPDSDNRAGTVTPGDNGRTGQLERQATRSNEEAAGRSRGNNDESASGQANDEPAAKNDARNDAAGARRGEKRAKAWTRHRDRERRAVAAQRDDWRQWQQDSRQWQQRSVMRTRDARYDGAREFVDQDGVRHIILPRRWRDRDDGDMAFDRPAQGRRPIVVRPSGLFGLFGDDGYGD